ncbi:MAG: hypothetical protein IJ722_00550 [Alloprevotella sp.]|nr:hypothetical protein [Alloprevotella sp.]
MKTSEKNKKQQEPVETLADIVREDLAEAIRDEKADKKAGQTSDEKAAKAFKELVSEDDNARPNISLRTLLGGDILAGPWFWKQFWFLVMIVAMMIVYVSNRYYCQQEMIEGTRLADTLLDRRYKALTLSSQLKELTRRSVVEKHLTDTALKTSTDPIFTLPVDERDTISRN